MGIRFHARFLVFLSLLLVLAAGCSSGSNTTPFSPTPAAGEGGTASAAARPAAFPYEARGTDGVSVRLARQPARIISLSAGTTESLFAIGAGGQVIAVDRFSDFPEEVKSRPKVDYSRPSVESLVAQQPDLVIASSRQRDTVPTLREAGLPVVMFEEAATIADVLGRIREFGRITGHAEQADALVADLDRRIQAVKARVAGAQQGPRVYHEVSSQLHSATPSSFVGDFYTLLRARNIAEGASGPFPQLSQEAIIQRDPDVIVLADGREGVTVEQVRARPGWSAIAAIKNGRINLLPAAQADMLSRPGPRVADGLEYLAKLLYPELF